VRDNVTAVLDRAAHSSERETGPEKPAAERRERPVRLLVLDDRPREIVVLGRRDGVVVESAAGVCLVEAPAEARSPAES